MHFQCIFGGFWRCFIVMPWKTPKPMTQHDPMLRKHRKCTESASKMHPKCTKISMHFRRKKHRKCTESAPGALGLGGRNSKILSEKSPHTQTKASLEVAKVVGHIHHLAEHGSPRDSSLDSQGWLGMLHVCLLRRTHTHTLFLQTQNIHDWHSTTNYTIDK